MVTIYTIKEWLKGNREMDEKKNMKVLRVAIRLNMDDAAQCGLARALLTRLDVFWAELQPGELKELMKDLRIRQIFDMKLKDQASVELLTGDRTPTQPVVTPVPAIVAQPLPDRKGIIVYQNDAYYHNAKDIDLCQCKHTKAAHIANPPRPYCLVKNCPCSFFIKQYIRQPVIPQPPKFTSVTEQKMPVLLEFQPVVEDGTMPLDKTQSSD